MSPFPLLARVLARLDGPAAERLAELLLVKPPLLLSWPRPWRRNLARIRAHAPGAGGGRSDAELLRESARLYLRFLLCMLAHPSEEEYVRTRVDLPILGDIERARKGGKGVIVALSNYGRVGDGLWALSLSREIVVPVLNPRHMDAFEPRLRAMFAPLGRSSRRAAEALRANGVVTLIADFNFLSRRHLTPFFGAPAPVGYAASKLALMTGAPILPAYAEPDGERCRFEAETPVEPAGLTLDELNAALARSLEKRVAAHPERWMVYMDFWDVRRMERLATLARRLAPWT